MPLRGTVVGRVEGGRGEGTRPVHSEGVDQKKSGTINERCRQDFHRMRTLTILEGSSPGNLVFQLLGSLLSFVEAILRFLLPEQQL